MKNKSQTYTAKLPAPAAAERVPTPAAVAPAITPTAPTAAVNPKSMVDIDLKLLYCCEYLSSAVLKLNSQVTLVF